MWPGAALTLLVGDVMLCTGDHTGILNALDRFGHANSSQNRVRREAFPVTASSRGTTNRACDWTKLDVNAFTPVLFAHGPTPLVHQTAVKSGCCRQACGKRRCPVRKANTQRRILQAQVLVKAKTGHRTDVANAYFALPAIPESVLWSVTVRRRDTYPTPVVMLTFSRSVI